MSILSALFSSALTEAYLSDAGAGQTVRGPGGVDMRLTHPLTAITVTGSQPLAVILRQDATGGRTVTWSANVATPPGFPALSSAPGRYDVVDLLPDPADGTFTATFRAQNVVPAVVPAVPTTPVAIPPPAPLTGPLVMPDTSFDGFGIRARDCLDWSGCCGSLHDATPAQYQAALDFVYARILRGNYVHTTSDGSNSDLPIMQEVRALQAAAGTPQVRFG